MQNPWQGLVWRVAGVLNGFNGDTICRRRLLQQGYIRGYGSQYYAELRETCPFFMSKEPKQKKVIKAVLDRHLFPNKH